MLPTNENKHALDELATRYFTIELGLAPDEASDASNNLMAAFDVLLRIDERLKKAQVTQPL